METPVFMRVTELARLADMSKAAISIALKQEDPKGLETNGKRIVGIAPELVHKFLERRKLDRLSGPKLFVISTQTGGAGKTSSTLNLATAARRITSTKDAIVLVDADSQASLSLQVAGEPAEDMAPVLVNWFDGKCCAKDLLSPTGMPNTFIIKSNLNNIYLDRSISKPAHIKTQALRLVKEIIQELGPNTKIFVDTPPQLSSVGSSFALAAAQMGGDGHLMIPVRPDLFGIKGAKICLTEIYEALTAFGISNKDLKATVFLSSLDQRTKTSVKTITTLSRDEVLSEFLAPVAIRYSTEVTKASYKFASVFSDYKNATTIGQDYLDLLLAALGHEGSKETARG